MIKKASKEAKTADPSLAEESPVADAEFHEVLPAPPTFRESKVSKHLSCLLSDEERRRDRYPGDDDGGAPGGIEV